MDPQLMMMLGPMLQQFMGQQQGQWQHPLSRAFGGMPMYSGQPVRPSQMFDLGTMGLGNSPMGMMAGMMMQSMVPQLAGNNFITGQFAPTQNIYDHRYATRYFNERQIALQEAAKTDRQTYFEMVRGFDRMRGVDYTPESQQGQSAMRLAGDISNITPIIGDMFPDWFDQLHGQRQSAQGLAKGIFAGGRYSIDPASGMLGFSGASAGAISSEVYDSLYGPNADITRMSGIGAKRAGEMYDEMVRRGFGPSATLDDEDAERKLRRELGRRPDEMRSPQLKDLRRKLLGDSGQGDTDDMEFNKANKKLEEGLQALNPQAMDAALRSFNATRTIQSLEKMSGAVAAMRDIFGDMGRPNAPMLELINGLQTLTQGGMARMSPEQLATSVRQTYNIAKYTGLGLEGILGFAGTAGNILQQQGGNRALAVNIAQKSALYGFAFGRVAQPQGFGAIDQEMASQIDVRLRSQAAVSPQAVRLAGALQLADEFVREDGGVGFAEDTEAYALTEAVRKGATTYEYNGVQKNVYQSIPGLTDILAQAGPNKAQSAQALSMPIAAAQKRIERYKIGDTVRAGQGLLDLKLPFSAAFSLGAANALENKNLSLDEQGELSSKIGELLFTAYPELQRTEPELFADGKESLRNKRLAEIIRDQLGPAGDKLNQTTLQNAISAGLSGGENFVGTPGTAFSAYPSMTAAFQLNNPDVAKMSKRLESELKTVTQLQEMFSAVGQTPPLGRLADFIRTAKPGEITFTNALAAAAGLIPTDALAGPAGSIMGYVGELRQQLDEVKGSPEKQEEQRAEILTKLGRILPDLSGILQGKIVKPEDLSAYGQELVAERRVGGKDSREATSPLNLAHAKMLAAYKELNDAAGEVGPTQDDAARTAKIKELREKAEAAGGELDQQLQKAGIPGIKKPVVVGDKEIMSSGDVNKGLAGLASLTVTSQTTTMPDARVDITAKEIKIQQGIATAPPSDKKEDLDDDGEEAVAKTQRITGRLELVGLDQAILVASTEPVNTGRRSNA